MQMAVRDEDQAHMPHKHLTEEDLARWMLMTFQEAEELIKHTSTLGNTEKKELVWVIAQSVSSFLTTGHYHQSQMGQHKAYAA